MSIVEPQSEKLIKLLKVPQAPERGEVWTAWACQRVDIMVHCASLHTYCHSVDDKFYVEIEG